MESTLYTTGYEIQETVQAIKDAGLPDETAERLLPDSVGKKNERQRRNPWF
jgi:hypothetical protein